MTAVPLVEVVRFLDAFLRVGEVPDEPNAVNGLEVENRGRVGRVVAAVDASLEAIEGLGGTSPASEAPLLVVHHGLFWDGNVALTGRRFRRVKALLDRDAALYAAHIPLDVHPEVGNNVELAQRLGLPVAGWFGNYRGVPIGVHGAAPPALADRNRLVAALEADLDTTARLIPGGPERVRRIGIVTGAAGSMIAAARDAGLDTFITGEGAHHTYFDAMEWGVNVIYAGHYATEQVGVQALARRIHAEFGLPWEFHRHPTGL
ncbi:MAG: Nif3-like dinuclear metal center hexameric protein [Deltaproteobacteria bacterium]